MLDNVIPAAGDKTGQPLSSGNAADTGAIGTIFGDVLRGQDESLAGEVAVETESDLLTEGGNVLYTSGNKLPTGFVFQGDVPLPTHAGSESVDKLAELISDSGEPFTAESTEDAQKFNEPALLVGGFPIIARQLSTSINSPDNLLAKAAADGSQVTGSIVVPVAKPVADLVPSVPVASTPADIAPVVASAPVASTPANTALAVPSIATTAPVGSTSADIATAGTSVITAPVAPVEAKAPGPATVRWNPVSEYGQKTEVVDLSAQPKRVDSGQVETFFETPDRFVGLDSSPAKPLLPSSLPGPNSLPLAVTQADGVGVTKAAASSVTTSFAGDGNWNTEFAGRVTVAVKNGLQEASIQLSPPELGRLEIKITTDGDQAKILFHVQNVAAREAIEQAMPRLREMLEQDGLQLAHGEVFDHSSRSHQGDDGEAGSFEFDATADVGEANSDESQLEVVLQANNSIVDYYI